MQVRYDATYVHVCPSGGAARCVFKVGCFISVGGHFGAFPVRRIIVGRLLERGAKGAVLKPEDGGLGMLESVLLAS